jgi:tryptophan synthase alpha chain
LSGHHSGRPRELAATVKLPIFIMTYASLVAAKGSARFARLAAEAGAKGLIVPDLPPDYDEGLFAAGREAGLAIAPVVAPGISDARLALVAGLAPEYVYTALRLGITGVNTSLGEESAAFLAKLAGLCGKIIAGFGVRSREQMLALSGRAHAAAVGTYFLDCLEKAGGDTASLVATAAALTGSV